MSRQYGASPQEWSHFADTLKLESDLLPVVSNPNATISPDSKMKSLGKTPSRYNRKHEAAGIAAWTSNVATHEDIEAWKEEPDYGICVQTRSMRALDIDVPDPAKSAAIAAVIDEWVRNPARRTRQGTGKFLVPFRMPGDFGKRSFKVDGGIVEFLATGQQFVACGTHPDGTRYEWNEGLPVSIPTVIPAAFEMMWAELVAKFAIEAPSINSASDRKTVLAEAASHDPVAVGLDERGMVLSEERDGRLNIICPFAETHTTEGAESATTYFPAHTGGYENGNFKCLHAHCDHRTNTDFLQKLGLWATVAAEGFEAIDDQPHEVTLVVLPSKSTRPRAKFIDIDEFVKRPAPTWIIKGILPKAESVAIYGDWGSGKTFIAIDMACAIARGEPWAGHKVKQGKVGILAAEDADGMALRLRAYMLENPDAKLAGRIKVMDDNPRLMDKEALIALGNEMIPEKFDVIIIDTFARVATGMEESSNSDMNEMVERFRVLHDVTGATIVIVHHTGKDASRGMRGASSLPAALYAAIEVTRDGDDRAVALTKMKNGNDRKKIGFKLNIVTLGVDEDLDDITSCVVEYGAVQIVSEQAKPRGEHQKLVWDRLDDMFEQDQEWPSTEKLAASIAASMGGEEDTRRDRANRVLRAMESKKLIETINGAVQKVRQGE